MSTSNRNFEGRQGVGARTVLASPAHRRRGRRHRSYRRSAPVRPLSFPGKPVVNKVSSVRSRTVVLPQSDIDTDQIIPARFLTTTTRNGLGKGLFADWRYDGNGAPRADFALNRPEAAGCAILVAGDNFGCGSSREHAPWALLDFGIQAVISTAHRRHLSQQLAEERAGAGHRRCRHARLADRSSRRRRHHRRRHAHAAAADGRSVDFPLDGFARYCLLNGVDQLGYLLKQIARHRSV